VGYGGVGWAAVGWGGVVWGGVGDEVNFQECRKSLKFKI